MAITFDLASIASSAAEESILRHFVERKRLHIRAADPRRVESLLSLAEFERLIAAGAIPANRILMQFNGESLADILYRDMASKRPKPEAVQTLCRQGASVVVNGIHKLVPSVAEFAEALERRFGLRTNGNCYLSNGPTPAFGAHCDASDVIVVQLLGAKRWCGYGPTAQPLDRPTLEEDVNSKDQVWEEELRPGDLLFLPLGEIHRVVPIDIPSLHLTFGIEPDI